MQSQIISVKPWKAWNKETNKSGERLGTTYTIIRYKPRGPVLIDVKVPGTEIITAEEIRSQAAKSTAVWADFKGYEEDAYARDNNIHYTATAESVELDPNAILID